MSWRAILGGLLRTISGRTEVILGSVAMAAVATGSLGAECDLGFMS